MSSWKKTCNYGSNEFYLNEIFETVLFHNKALQPKFISNKFCIFKKMNFPNPYFLI